MEYKQIPLEKAATETIDKLTGIGGFGGIIAVDGKGNPVMKFNTTGMFRGYVKSDGTRFVGIHGGGD
jgi:beta-aspartyl-peptidase (threonine type)